jgi:hypothetical protein
MHLNLSPTVLAETAVAGIALLYLSGKFAQRDQGVFLKNQEYEPFPAIKIPWSDWTNTNNNYWKFTKEIPNWVTTYSYSVNLQRGNAGIPNQNFLYEFSLERPYSGKGENTQALLQSKKEGPPQARTIRPLLTARYYDWVTSKNFGPPADVNNFWHQVADRVGF